MIKKKDVSYNFFNISDFYISENFISRLNKWWLLISFIFLFFFIVQCNTNPCELGGDFSPPNYQCIQAVDDFNNVICTCPDGGAEVNRPCRKRIFNIIFIFIIS